jgi:beta-lactam-binding protein with PASTA domain
MRLFLLALLVLALGIGLSAQRTLPSIVRTTTMPNVTGLSRKAALAAIAKAKLTTYYILTSPGGVNDRVIGQSPRAGSTLLQKTDVMLKISTGGL